MLEQIHLIEALQLYSISLQSYGSSPYIYPCYGLGGLPESFSRLAAIHGGTFMLSRGVDEVPFQPPHCLTFSSAETLGSVLLATFCS